MGRIWIGLLLALMAAAVVSARPVALPEQAELSMLVTGTLELEPDGSVSRWELDQPDRLPKVVVELVAKAAPGWKFEPVLVEGEPVRTRVRTSLRVVASRAGDDTYRVSLRSAHFGEAAMTAEERQALGRPADVRAIDMGPPTYPADALRAGAQGTVYVVLKIDRDGSVEDVVVEQVNLRTVGNERQMRWMRDVFAKATLQAVRKWSFLVPTEGEDAGRDYWSLRIPVSYAVSRDGEVPEKVYGQWDAYIPGPRQRAPWASDEDASPDAMVAGQIYLEGRQRKLLTPLQSG